MKKKSLIYLSVIQTIIILVFILITICSSVLFTKPQKADLTEYLSELSEEHNYFPDRGYIPDAETAKAVGEKIIDSLTGNKGLGAISIKYDEENRLWQVGKSYLFRGGGFVIIEQDSGRVIKALLTK